MQRRRFFRVALAATGLSLAATFATPALAADEFPSRPIRLIVPYGAGGVTDQVTRALADAASRDRAVWRRRRDRPGHAGAGRCGQP